MGLWSSGVLHSPVRGDSLHANDPDQDNLLCEACEKTSEGRTKQKTSCVGGNNFGPNTLCISERQTVPPNSFEDNEAVIKMIIFVRHRTMRHVPRTNCVAFDWLFDLLKLGPYDPCDIRRHPQPIHGHPAQKIIDS